MIHICRTKQEASCVASPQTPSQPCRQSLDHWYHRIPRSSTFTRIINSVTVVNNFQLIFSKLLSDITQKSLLSIIFISPDLCAQFIGKSFTDWAECESGVCGGRSCLTPCPPVSWPPLETCTGTWASLAHHLTSTLIRRVRRNNWSCSAWTLI